jgi:hypothetical protein
MREFGKDLLTLAEVLAVMLLIGFAIAWIVPRIVDLDRLAAPEGTPQNDRTRPH